MTAKEIAKFLNVTELAIYNQAFKLKLKKEVNPGGFKKGSEIGKEYRFQKGIVPHNKGKKMSPHQYEKCKNTMFKKGNIPGNARHNGNPYIHIRQRKNGLIEKVWMIHKKGEKRRSYLTYLCEQNGIDLKGKIPRLKNGFDTNKVPTMDDIVIISYQKNMRLNSINNYPEEITKLIYAKKALNQQIKKTCENEKHGNNIN